MSDPLRSLLDDLCSSPHREAGGRLLLEQLRAQLDRDLQAAGLGKELTVLGGSLHFNRGEGFTEGIRFPTGTGADASSSRSLWACLESGVAWVFFDIPSLELHLPSGERRILPGPQQRTGTLERLRRHLITHVLAFPLA
ncbi:MAG TPA: hypothetical protein PKW90_11170, partial [Myxococcota bacterium]|nr:hypothetical protein [Myxococcota bacterium]